MVEEYSRLQVKTVPSFIKGVVKVAWGTAYTTSHSASVVVPKPMAGPARTGTLRAQNVSHLTL